MPSSSRAASSAPRSPSGASGGRASSASGCRRSATRARARQPAPSEVAPRGRLGNALVPLETMHRKKKQGKKRPHQTPVASSGASGAPASVSISRSTTPACVNGARWPAPSALVSCSSKPACVRSRSSSCSVSACVPSVPHIACLRQARSAPLIAADESTAPSADSISASVATSSRSRSRSVSRSLARVLLGITSHAPAPNQKA
mmetsp:Transcript_21833/g.67715  ORF Transcript_21833/g.67715 Transcript_21833/m.67715 type:complete len:204 (+) Transcript_21833:48-659(+)